MYNPQITHDRIMILLTARNETAKNMCKRLGLAINTVHSVAHTGTGLRSSTLCAIADYLECSTDYLLGRTNTP